MANLFSDTFNRADNTSLGANWTETVGDLEIKSNLVTNHVTSECMALVTASLTLPSADYSVSADVAATTTNNAGVIARYVDNSNYYYLRILQGTGFQLFKKVTGSFTTMQTYSTTITASQIYNIKLELIGTTLNGYLDSTLRITQTDSAFASSGSVGIRINSGAVPGGNLDNFSVDTSSTTIAPGLMLMGVGC